MEEAVNTIYNLSEDERIRQQCQAREDWERRTGWVMREFERAKNELVEKDAIISERDEIISKKDEIISEKDEIISKKDAENEKLKEEIRRLKAEKEGLI